ncbi:jg21847 [Pararge aegeria aegeria]|uniref:Jg21847 protein n=1 Tax=Pararge aegeria aegeria TaxID=348720 RepID=A0A8S4SQ39_9NEOP|nr:jg21847 [Pararge aegeria aegeria]
MSGVVFGIEQSIDLYLIVYATEMKSANAFRLEIESCAFSCTNSIKVSSDLPSACDGDVFCFMTNFSNPNRLVFTTEEYSENFDALYLIIKLANTFSWSAENGEPVKSVIFNNKKADKKSTDKNWNPIFMTDGLVALDILNSMAKDLPSHIFYCPTPITAIARGILGDYLQVRCSLINELLVWAANDEVFHVEVEKPLVAYDVSGDKSRCQSDLVGKDILQSRNFDTTQLSASWMKKEFIEKVCPL